jgi:hypothetical protein
MFTRRAAVGRDGGADKRGEASMSGVARIIYSGGELMIPIHDGYDLEHLLEHTKGCVQRYGQAWLDVGRSAWLIRVRMDDVVTECTCCHQRRADFLFEGASSGSLCSRCAHGELRAHYKSWPGFFDRSRVQARIQMILSGAHRLLPAGTST